VLSEAAGDGLAASTGGPQIAAAGLSTWGGLPALSPGGLATITGTSLASAAQAAGVPLPSVLGNTFVSVEGVRAPLFASAAGSIEFQVPGDINRSRSWIMDRRRPGSQLSNKHPRAPAALRH
jgi:uncharacterized protein (TIGR03437 family)